MATDQSNQPDDAAGTIDLESGPSAPASPWYRRPRNLAIVGLLVAAMIAALVFVVGRDSAPSGSGASAPLRALAPGESIQSYFKDNDITATPVRPGEPGAPAITFPMPPGWSDAGPDTPGGAYGAAFFDGSVDEEFPSSVVILLSRLAGEADPAKILEYAPGELQGLPDYRPVSAPKRSTLSGFEAVQLGGLYTRDGAERIIAQTTVVIPSQTALYVLQMNADGPKAEAPEVQAATGVLDEAKITP